MKTPVVHEARRAGEVRLVGATAHAPEHLLDAATLGDHLDRLFRAAWGLCGSREDAEDLVQDTYARVIARPRVVRHGGDLAYLLRALHNTFLSNCRARARRPRAANVAFDDLDLADPRRGEEPDAAAEAREVYSAIAALPPAFRDAVVAVDVAGLSYREAAKALRVREATLTTRLFRARNQVARSLRVT